MCCSVLQCVAVCCSVLQCVAVRCSVLQCVAVCCCMLQCVAVCCTAVHNVAVCYSVLQCVALNFSVLRQSTGVDSMINYFFFPCLEGLMCLDTTLLTSLLPFIAMYDASNTRHNSCKLHIVCITSDITHSQETSYDVSCI